MNRYRVMLRRLTEKVRRANGIQHSGGEITPEDWAELHQLENEAFAMLDGPPEWTIVADRDARLIYKCPDCLTKYQIGVDEASIPYCTKAGCANEDSETDFDRLEVRA